MIKGTSPRRTRGGLFCVQISLWVLSSGCSKPRHALSRRMKTGSACFRSSAKIGTANLSVDQSHRLLRGSLGEALGQVARTSSFRVSLSRSFSTRLPPAQHTRVNATGSVHHLSLPKKKKQETRVTYRPSHQQQLRHRPPLQSRIDLLNPAGVWIGPYLHGKQNQRGSYTHPRSGALPWLHGLLFTSNDISLARN